MREAEFADALASAQSGEAAGFEVLYREFAPSVLGFLRGRVGGDAEDVAASTWMDVAGSVTRFVGDEAGFRSWLFTIVRRRLMNEFRRRSRDWSDTTDPARLPLATATATAAAAADPETVVLANLATDDAVAIITAVLPELQGEVILLRVVGQLPVADVAQVLDLAPGHVRVLTHRGLQALARHFSTQSVTPAVGPGISEVS